MVEFYYNLETHEVEEGKQSNSFDRAGPFDSREAAGKAPELIEQRSREWAEEDAQEDA